MRRLLQVPLRALTIALVSVLCALGCVSYVVLSPGSASAADTAVADQPGGELGQGLGREAFIGSWRLKSFEARLSDGQVIYPFGQDADGVLTYTQDGRMSVAVWKANRQPFAISDQQRGTPDENTAAVRSYITYLGTFSVDREANTVSHVVEQSIFPNWNGGTQTRIYKFTDHGNRLELTTPPTPFGGQTLIGALVWERIGRDNG